MISGEIDVLQGPVQMLDLFPWIIPYVPKIIKNKWMKVDWLEHSRQEFVSFIQVSLYFSVVICYTQIVLVLFTKN